MNNNIVKISKSNIINKINMSHSNDAVRYGSENRNDLLKPYIHIDSVNPMQNKNVYKR